MITFTLFLVLSASPQLDVDTLGPYKVGTQAVSFQDANFGRGTITGIIYYPATATGPNQPVDVSGGPYPLVGWSHGYTEPVTDYAPLLSHLASWGFVVAGIGTETGIFADMEEEANDLRALMHWAEDESFDTNAWLFQSLDHLNWGAGGHSMGGASMGYLARDEARVSDIAMLEPYHGSYLGSSYPAFNQFHNYDGRLLVVAGSEDTTCPADSSVKPWFNKATGTENAFFVNIQGGGHFGATIWPNWEGSLSASEQQRMHFRLLASFMLVGLKDEDNRMAAITGFQADNDPAVKESRSNVPSIWLGQDVALPNELFMGIAGQPNNHARMGYSFTSGNRMTRFGLVEIDIATANIFIRGRFSSTGIRESTIVLPASWSGTTLYIQGASVFAGAGSVSRATTFLVP